VLVENLFIVFGWFILFFIVESLFPFNREHGGKLIHSGKNLLAGIAGVVLAIFFFFPLVESAVRLNQGYRTNVLHLIMAPYFIKFALGILLLDLWMYIWHILSHKIPFLWKFHRVQHTDDQLDASSGLRFHPGEVVFTLLGVLLPVFFIGVDVKIVSYYGLFLVAAKIMQHSNIGFLYRADIFLRIFILSPTMQRVHHSSLKEESNSNFSVIFSVWDRIFDTFNVFSGVETVIPGLNEFREREWLTIFGMLITPFVKDEERESGTS